MIPIDLLPINIAIYEYKEGDFVFVQFNRQAEETDQIKREELLGKKVTDVFPGVKEFGLFDVFERVYKTGQSEHFQAGYYRDEIREGWRVNDVSRLDDGCVMAVYKDVTQEIQTAHRENELGNLINKSLNEIYIFDKETLLFVYANAGALTNIGYTMEELSQMTPLEIKPLFNEETFQILLQPLIDETLQLLSIETKHRRKDGTLYDVEVRIQKMIYTEKEHFVVIGMDISDRVNNQREMIKLQHIIEQSDDLMMITDCEGVIEYVNGAYTKLTGWEKEKLLGVKPSLLKSGKSPQEFYDEMWKTILSGKTYKGNIQNRKKDKSYYWEEKTITPIRLNGDTITHFISTGKDITDQIQLKEALEESAHLFKTLTESSLAGIFLYQENFLYANQAYTSSLGYTLEELKQMTPMDIVVPEDRELIAQRMQSRLRGELHDQITYQDIKIITKSGEIRWFYIAIVTVKYHGKWTGLGTAIDMTERKHMEQQLERTAQTDILTGLYNRLKFDEIIAREISCVSRHNSSFSLIYLDIDFFKKINDTHGHDVGDIILKEISEIIRKTIRVSDYPFRWGGEEFIIICPSTPMDDAKVLAERLREGVEKTLFVAGGKTTISVGVTPYCVGETVDEMIKRGDSALYQAKKEGRNRVCSSFC